jgi:hypothetical protein
VIKDNVFLFVLAQHQGPIDVLLVNDSEFALEVIWLNQFTAEIGKDELTRIRTGPVQPRSVERYKSYPSYSIQVHKADDKSCNKDEQNSQQCHSIIFHIVSTEDEEPSSELHNCILF